MELELNPRITPFSLGHTLSCGQVFRWKRDDNNWFGVVDETVVRVSQRGNKLDCKGYPEEREDDFVKEYFRLDDGLPCIATLINKDRAIGEALDRLHGLRIIRQDPWECLLSVICATVANLPRIKGMVYSLCRRFGKRIDYRDIDGEDAAFYGFPTKETLTTASVNELLGCNLGYRAKYVKDVSQSLVKNRLNLNGLREASYGEARDTLMSLRGVGHKVADCVLLFSLEKLEAFPVDIWVSRILQKHYANHFAPGFGKRDLTPRVYKECNDFGRGYFGKYAGYAQEYLFAEFSPVMTRCQNNKDRRQVEL